MKFRTAYSPRRSCKQLHPDCQVLLLGSCFSDNVGARMRRAMLPAVVNPCGVLFNPLSIASVISAALDGILVKTERIGELWGSYLFSGEFLKSDPEIAEKGMNEALDKLRETLRNAESMIVTFGTAFTYTLLADDTIVSNCHKQPASLFKRDMIAPGSIEACWIHLLERVFNVNPKLKVIFTVSPVRHVKEGMHANSLSKASLMLGVEGILRNYPENCEYFPAYEIVIDDLRDYRFFAEDMVHPSAQAVDYIWDIFCREHYDDEGIKLIEEAERLRSRMNHRSLHPGSESDKSFQMKTDCLLSEFLEAHPSLLP